MIKKRIMKKYSVVGKIKITKQPRGGYLNPKDFSIEELDSKNLIKNIQNENYHPSIVGLAVDYLTRFMITKNAKKSFEISLMGARNLGLLENAFEILKNIKENLNKKTIYSALKLCEFDVAYRVDPSKYITKNKTPNKQTIKNIVDMVKNSINFFKKYGPIKKEGFSFFDKENNKNGYSDVVVAGDGDFLTEDTIWDFKVSKHPPKSIHTLQLLMYFLMGKKSKINYFKNIKYLGIYNPRLNIVYRYNILKISLNILKEISKDIIEYNDISFLDKIFN